MQYSDVVVIPVIGTVGDDSSQHMAKQSFCDNPTRGCHKDEEWISDIVERVLSGEITPRQAIDMVKGMNT